MSKWYDPLLKNKKNQDALNAAASSLKKKHKYSAETASSDGYSFASKGEAALYHEHKLELRAGLIREIQVQDHVYLSRAKILYIADFKLFDLVLSEYVWTEFKGFQTPEWRIKRRLWKAYGPGRLRVYNRQADRMILIEEIIPNTNSLTNGEIASADD